MHDDCGCIIGHDFPPRCQIFDCQWIDCSGSAASRKLQQTEHRAKGVVRHKLSVKANKLLAADVVTQFAEFFICFNDVWLHSSHIAARFRFCLRKILSQTNVSTHSLQAAMANLVISELSFDRKFASNIGLLTFIRCTTETKQAQEESYNIPNPEEFIQSDFRGVLFVNWTATMLTVEWSDISRHIEK